MKAALKNLFSRQRSDGADAPAGTRPRLSQRHRSAPDLSNAPAQAPGHPVPRRATLPLAVVEPAPAEVVSAPPATSAAHRFPAEVLDNIAQHAAADLARRAASRNIARQVRAEAGMRNLSAAGPVFARAVAQQTLLAQIRRTELSEESIHALIGARGIEGTIRSLPVARQDVVLLALWEQLNRDIGEGRLDGFRETRLVLAAVAGLPRQQAAEALARGTASCTSSEQITALLGSAQAPGAVAGLPAALQPAVFSGAATWIAAQPVLQRRQPTADLVAAIALLPDDSAAAALQAATTHRTMPWPLARALLGTPGQAGTVLGLPDALQAGPLHHLVDFAAASTDPRSRAAVREAVERLPNGVDDGLKRRSRAL